MVPVDLHRIYATAVMHPLSVPTQGVQQDFDKTDLEALGATPKRSLSVSSRANP